MKKNKFFITSTILVVFSLVCCVMATVALADDECGGTTSTPSVEETKPSLPQAETAISQAQDQIAPPLSPPEPPVMSDYEKGKALSKTVWGDLFRNLFAMFSGVGHVPTEAPPDTSIDFGD